MRDKIYVLYHQNCFDGFGAAYAAWQWFGNRGEYIPVTHGQEPPEMEEGSKVYIVDFAYPRKTLLEMAKVYDIQVIDHHKTAQADLEDLPYALFDMEHSGAVLTWQYFFPEVEVPPLLLYIEDRDLWKWELPDSRAISAAMHMYPYDFSVWKMLRVNELVQEGKVILAYQQQQVELICNQAHETIIGGYIVPTVNATSLWSEVGEYLLNLYPDAPFSATYYETRDGKRKWSLRANGKVDVSEIARSEGGGGHRDAAGFVEDIYEPPHNYEMSGGYTQLPFKKL